MRRLTIAAVAAASLLLLLPGLAVAQSAAVLAFFENNSGSMLVNTPSGDIAPEDIGIGGEVPVGSTIITEDGDFAEIELTPSQSIIRIAENTNFQIEGLQGTNGAAQSTFRSPAGKFRAVIARTTGADRYQFAGQTAVMGVRGTEFVNQSGIGEEIFAVLEGIVDVTNAAGEVIQLAANQSVNALSGPFSPTPLTDALRESLLAGMEFLSDPPPAPPAGDGDTGDGTDGDGTDGDGTDGDGTGDDAGDEPTAEEQVQNALLEKLREILGMEIGSITIGDTTYSKAIIQPTFDLGAARIGMYIPLIYESNIFDPDDWYLAGAEWSFGRDEFEAGEYVLGALDILNDLFLKFRFIEIGDNRDPFFLGVGNLDDITVGHGTIMRAFTNNTEFPAVRVIGLHTGFNGEKGGLEVVLNNVSAPEIFGLRGHLRVAGRLGIGLTALTDIAPVGAVRDLTGDPSVADVQDAIDADPVFVNIGTDLDLPIVENDGFAIIAFADVAGMMPALRNPAAGLAAGLRTEAMFTEAGGFQNWGVNAGLLGNVSLFDYRAEFRWYNGLFKPAFYNQVYERNRIDYAQEVVDYLVQLQSAGPDDQTGEPTIGIYAEGGLNIPEIVSVTLGYQWPFALLDGGGIGPSDDDLFVLAATLEPGVIPLVPVHGSIEYVRSKFASTFDDESLTLFDENTVVSAEVIYEAAPTLDVALLYTTALARDQSGALAQPEQVVTTLSIETRVSF